MVKHLQAKAHVAELNELTESKVSELRKYNHGWNSFHHTEETRQSRNDNSKFAEEIPIRQLDFTYIDTIYRPTAATWQQRTLQEPNITKTPGIAIPC